MKTNNEISLKDKQGSTGGNNSELFPTNDQVKGVLEAVFHLFDENSFQEYNYQLIHGLIELMVNIEHKKDFINYPIYASAIDGLMRFFDGLECLEMNHSQIRKLENIEVKILGGPRNEN
jgi:hypothetical protein